jgi:hypothetical protein
MDTKLFDGTAVFAGQKSGFISVRSNQASNVTGLHRKESNELNEVVTKGRNCKINRRVRGFF